MRVTDTLTALHTFSCETTGQRGCVAGQRVKVVRRFTVNSGERVAVADPDSGEVLAWQVPAEWFISGDKIQTDLFSGATA